MTREEAYQILTTYLKTPNLIKHSLATEVTMKALYKKLHKENPSKEEEEKWGITGLLHDADYEMSKATPKYHGLLLVEKIEIKSQLPEDVAYAIKAHNFEHTKFQPKSLIDWSIYCCDELTGLIVAAALIHPLRKLSALTSDFVLNRFDERSFAKGADRKKIKLCEEKLGIPLKEFIEITLSAMQKISYELGL